MVKIITQDDLDPNGFVCTGDGKITPVAPAVSFACPQLNACNIDMLDGITLAGATAGQQLVYDGTQIIATDALAPDEIIITQAGHGFTLPVYGFLPIYANAISGTWLRASTLTLDRTHAAFVIDVLTPDTFVVKYGGPITVTAHGLALGQKYYLRDDGSISITADADIIDKVAIPLDADTILLLDDDAYIEDTPISQSGYVQDFVAADFVGAGPYGITIYAATHLLGATKYIRATVYESGAPNIEVIIQAKVDDVGTVVIETDTPFDGYVILTSHAGIIY